jgi:Uma2 family endonuclease
VPVSEKLFRRIALEDPSGHWELHNGCLRQKPGMSIEHNVLMSELAFVLMQQLDRSQFHVRSNAGHVRHSAASYYIPDVFVIPVELQRSLWGTRRLEWYTDPLPLVVEIWSPSTGDFDVETKLAHYQERGDHEIWRIHPYEHTLIAWRRQPDGGYVEALFTSGIIEPVALPNVRIDLDALFAAAKPS